MQVSVCRLSGLLEDLGSQLVRRNAIRVIAALRIREDVAQGLGRGAAVPHEIDVNRVLMVGAQYRIADDLLSGDLRKGKVLSHPLTSHGAQGLPKDQAAPSDITGIAHGRRLKQLTACL